MAIQYYMRAYNTNLSKYVDWVVNDTADSTGAFSGYPTNQLINITVNRVVQSKVANFLKQNQSLGGTDGNFFHVNSYDWKNATAPIAPPTTLVGFAVENGLTALSPSSGINGATNASPIVITLSSPPTVPLVTGQMITIIGVTGNTNANGTWPIIVIDTTHFSLTGSTGSGTYTAGSGNAYLPTDMPTLTWDPVNNIWRFVLNTNGDGITLGASQSVKVNNFIMDGYLALGTDPADSGAIRLSNNTFINWEANPAGTDIQGIGVDNLNRIKLGSLTTDTVYTPGVIVVDGYVQHDGTGNNTASIGFIREKNNTTIVAFRTQNGLLDVAALSSNSANNILVGDATNTGILYNTSTSNIHQFQVNSVPSFEIGNTFARFTSTVTLPTILQTSTAVNNATGQTLVVQAQNSTVGGTIGGILSLTSGTGTNAHGTVDISTGGVLKARFFPTTASTASDNNSIQFFENLFRVDTAQTSPVIRQDTSNSLTTGNAFTIQAQNTSTASSVGGALNLTSGTGTTNAGQVLVQTGGVNQIIVSPLTIAPGGQTATTGTVIIRGNLEVVGTTTTVDSTVVDIIGRVIHANWADPIASPNVTAPTLNVGYSVHRGNSGGVPRDGAAWIWSEGAQNSGSDGYWRAVTLTGDGFGTDNFTFDKSPFTVGILGNSHIVTSDPNPVNGYLPNVGGLRNASNTTAVSARNTNVLTTISAASNLASLPQATINVTSTTGFTTNGGSLLIISSTGPQVVTYTGTSANTFTGAAGGSGTLAVGSAVAQTNASTTIASGSNGQTLPQSTINVATTVGFPQTGTIRIQTNGASGGVQTITYTGTGATTFTGCTGGTGVLATGNYVNSPPIAGTTDILLLGTDFGNRIHHGDGYAPTNSGHIFSTTTGSIFDFWVNSVTQLQLSANSDPADSFIATMGVGATVNSPKLYQIVQPNTGTNNGFNFKVAAQAGQQQTGGNNNNNGGNIVLASGAPGTGGSGTAGVNGSVDLNTGATLKMRIFPTTTTTVGNNNSIIYFENLFRVDTAQTSPLFRQDDNTTNGATATNYTVQAQNATGTTSTGGDIINTSGTGTTVAGNNRLQTGGVDRIIVHPTFTEFRDTAEAYRITPVSAGTTTLQAASTVTALTYKQADLTTNGGTGATTTLQSQNETGTTSTGGLLVLTSGTGTTTAGNVTLQTGAVDRVIVHPTFTEFRDTAEAYRITPVSAGTTTLQAASTVTAVTYKQADLTTNGGTAATTTIQAQNETGTTSTGGSLAFTTGTGTTNPGNMLFQIGGTTLLTLFNTTGNPNSLQWLSTTTAPTFNQGSVATNNATGAAFTIQAQNATGTTSTGGQLALTSGTGTTVAGNVNIQCGGTTIISAQPTLVALTQTILQYNNAVTAPLFKQADKTTNGGTGETFTVQAQNETGTTSTGGALNLTSGTGTTVAGNVNIQSGGVTTASVVPNKFVFNKGRRRNVTAVSTTYQVLASDDYLAITSSSVYTVTLPATPTTGDSYEFKDISGTSGINTITVSGNGSNIDGASTVLMNSNYTSLVVTYTGAQWSIS